MGYQGKNPSGSWQDHPSWGGAQALRKAFLRICPQPWLPPTHIHKIGLTNKGLTKGETVASVNSLTGLGKRPHQSVMSVLCQINWLTIQ